MRLSAVVAAVSTMAFFPSAIARITPLTPRQQSGRQACPLSTILLPMSSPLITYSPDDSTAAWDWTVNEPNAAPGAYLQYPRVRTSTPGAKLVYAFVGNSVRLNGTASVGASLVVRLEHLNENANVPNQTIMFTDGLGLQDNFLFKSDQYASTGDWMRMTVEVKNGTFEMNRIEYSIIYSCNTNTISGEDIFHDTISNPQQPYTLYGKWRGVRRDPTVAAGSPKSQQLLEAAPDASIAFDAPQTADYLEIYGYIGTAGGDYEVTVAPPPPGPPVPKDGTTPYSRTFKSSTKRQYGSQQPIWAGKLDSGTKYNFTVHNTDKNAALFLYSVKAIVESGPATPTGDVAPYTGLDQDNFTSQDRGGSSTSSNPGSSSSPSTSKGTNVGAIAGGVVGGVLGAILLALLGWWLWKRKRDPFKDDEPDETPQQTYAPTDMSQTTQFHSTRSLPMSSDGEFGTTHTTRSFASLPRLTPEGTGMSYPGSDGTSAAAVASHGNAGSVPQLARSSLSSRNVLMPISAHSTGAGAGDAPVSPSYAPASPLYAPASPVSPAAYTYPHPTRGQLQLTSPVESESPSIAGLGMGHPQAVSKTPRQPPRPVRQPSRRPLEEQDTVPPSYDPTWADDFVDGQQYLEPEIVHTPPQSPFAHPADTRSTPPLPTPPVPPAHSPLSQVRSLTPSSITPSQFPQPPNPPPAHALSQAQSPYTPTSNYPPTSSGGSQLTQTPVTGYASTMESSAYPQSTLSSQRTVPSRSQSDDSTPGSPPSPGTELELNAPAMSEASTDFSRPR